MMHGAINIKSHIFILEEKAEDKKFTASEEITV